MDKYGNVRDQLKVNKFEGPKSRLMMTTEGQRKNAIDKDGMMTTEEAIKNGSIETDDCKLTFKFINRSSGEKPLEINKKIFLV